VELQASRLIDPVRGMAALVDDHTDDSTLRSVSEFGIKVIPNILIRSLPYVMWSK
jgi:hypothetical protein